MSAPLVSCLSTTYDRPEFVPQLIRCFQRQTYPKKELVIVDASENSVEALCGGFDSIRYVRAAAGASSGACLNVAAENARGDILQKLDDDDYYAPRFLERAAAALGEATNAIVAWDCFFVLLRGERQLRFSGHGWAAGGTLSFHREVWRRRPFRDGSNGENFFIEDSVQGGNGGQITKICAPELYVLIRHGGNHWRDLRGSDVDAYFRSLPRARNGNTVMEREDLDFYCYGRMGNTR